MPTEIPNDRLKPGDLPAGDTDWPEIFSFAVTYNGYAAAGSFEACAELANQSIARYQATGALPSSLDDLRTCLFFEARRWRHYGDAPDAQALEYIRTLVAGIRNLVERPARS